MPRRTGRRPIRHISTCPHQTRWRQHRAEYPLTKRLETVQKNRTTSVFLSGLFAIVITLAICFGLGLSVFLSPHDGGIAMGMGVFQVGAGLILYTLGSRSLLAAELALLSLAEVLLGPIWVWLFLGETASANTLIGGAVLLAAIAGNALSGKRRKPPPITAP